MARPLGAIIVNPAKKNPLAVRVNSGAKKKRKTRSKARKNSLAVRRNSLAVKVNRKRRSARKTKSNRARARKNPYVKLNRAKGRSRARKNPYTRLRFNRKNPVDATMQKASKQIGSIPVVGGFLLGTVSLVIPAALGAVSVEPTMRLASVIGDKFPQLQTSWFYPLVGLGLAGIIKAGSSMVDSKDLKSALDKLAVAVAAGGGAVGYYKYRTGTDVSVKTEMGLLAMASGDLEEDLGSEYGDGAYSRVVPLDGRAG